MKITAKSIGLLAVLAVLIAMVTAKSKEESSQIGAPLKFESNGLSTPTQPTAADRAKAAVEACVNKGIAYFQSIKSYPKLSDGRIAVDVARERCRRTLTAFP